MSRNEEVAVEGMPALKGMATLVHPKFLPSVTRHVFIFNIRNSKFCGSLRQAQGKLYSAVRYSKTKIEITIMRLAPCALLLRQFHYFCPSFSLGFGG